MKCAYKGLLLVRSTAVLALLGAAAAHAATLPAPPVSPAPVVDYEYDAEGNPTKTTQAKSVAGFGFETRSTYDALNRRKDTTDARSKPTQFGYDGQDSLVSVKNPRNLSTGYTRNGLGDMTRLSSPDTGPASLTYDEAGNLKTRTDSRGVLSTYSYDALNRLTGVSHSKSSLSTRTYTWRYDETGADFSHGVGRLTSTDSPSTYTRYRYDPQGRLLSELQLMYASPSANVTEVSQTTEYGYDGAGHITSITYPSGRVVRYAYVNGLPTTITLAKDGMAPAQTLLSQISFNPDGQALGWKWHLNTPANHLIGYDVYGRVVRYRYGSLTRDITYDAADRIQAYTHYKTSDATAAPTNDQAFTYDELGRLKTIALSGPYWRITYDDNGNRSSVTIGSTTRSYTTAPDSNRLMGLSTPPRSFSYDTAGNLKQSGTGHTLDYGTDNRLRTLSVGGVSTVYAYNAEGQRVRKYGATPASTVIFVYDQFGHLLGEYDNAGKALREYVWLGDRPVAMFTPDPVATNPPRKFFIYTDHLNTPRFVVNMSDQRRWKWLADPFGTAAPDTNPDGLGAFTFNLRFPGQYADAESGLNYNYFRDYDPVLGRYVQSDPMGLGGGINTYAYVDGDPLGRTDPVGLWSVEFGGYIGVGGSLTLGRDPASGGGFVALKLGKGLGAGAAYEPLGGRAGGAASQCNKGGVGVGLFAEAGGHWGPVSARIGADWGRNFLSWFASSTGYGGIEPRAALETSWGIGVGAAGGVEITVFGSGNSCTCAGAVASSGGASAVNVPAPMLPWTQADFLYGRRR